MKVHRTAAMTAVWRSMAEVDGNSIRHVNLPLRFFAYILGFLDPNSVGTIAERTKLIDSLIIKLKPKCIVEIGAGFSLRAEKFDNIQFIELDLPYFRKFKNSITPFDITKDQLNINIKEALFIVEGVTMYLKKWQILELLKQIKKYKGDILIDFFNRGYSTNDKSMNENLYKLLFKLIINRNYLFDYNIENLQDGYALLKGLGYRNVRHFEYNVPKTLDILFYGRL